MSTYSRMAYYSPGVANKRGCKGEGEDPMLAVSWFHPHLTRHAADCMLIDNAPEGTYLLRASSDYQKDGSYVLSVKLSSSVQHIRVQSTGGGYTFGSSTFDSVESFKRHFEVEKPVIGGDSGITVVLKFPYVRFIKESHIYTDVVHHAVTHLMGDSDDSESDQEESVNEESIQSVPPSPLAINSKEGYLTKQGRVRKSWRCRWFILRSSSLSYYKTKQSQQPIRRLDLNQAMAVEYDNSKRKNYCFRIQFTFRTYYMYASCAEDCDQWVEILRSKLPTVPTQSSVRATSSAL
jgi:dual adaptor for phosphotyrosine/3-phosphotyrosine/3-phosphoinositide